MMADSSTLVPGDLVDLSEPSLHTFPADLILLSGDAIVNESMLTGESVPVSKIPIEPEFVPLVSSPGPEIAPELARYVVFNGTKIIRIRKTAPSVSQGGKPGADLEAVAMVVRTGFNTTKGALVRSMLFPKPFGCVEMYSLHRLAVVDRPVPQLRLLPRLVSVHRRPCWRRCHRLPRECRQLYQAWRAFSPCPPAPAAS